MIGFCHVNRTPIRILRTMNGSGRAIPIVGICTLVRTINVCNPLQSAPELWNTPAHSPHNVTQHPTPPHNILRLQDLTSRRVRLLQRRGRYVVGLWCCGVLLGSMTVRQRSQDRVRIRRTSVPIVTSSSPSRSTHSPQRTSRP